MNYAYQSLREFLALRQELDPLELEAERAGDDCGCEAYHFTTCATHERIAEIELRQESLVTQCAGNWAVLLMESIQFLEKFNSDAAVVLHTAKGE